MSFQPLAGISWGCRPPGRGHRSRPPAGRSGGRPTGRRRRPCRAPGSRPTRRPGSPGRRWSWPRRRSCAPPSRRWRACPPAGSTWPSVESAPAASLACSPPWPSRPSQLVRSGSTTTPYDQPNQRAGWVLAGIRADSGPGLPDPTNLPDRNSNGADSSRPPLPSGGFGQDRPAASGSGGIPRGREPGQAGWCRDCQARRGHGCRPPGQSASGSGIPRPSRGRWSLADTGPGPLGGHQRLRSSPDR
jgi:hypothetical protein